MNQQWRHDDWPECLVRVRVTTDGGARSIALVRVGWLTADLAGAIADDVRHTPVGTRVELLVPDDLSDAQITAIQEWLQSVLSPHVRVSVARSSEGAVLEARRSVTWPCDALPQSSDAAAEPVRAASGGESGLDLAFTDYGARGARLVRRRKS